MVEVIWQIIVICLLITISSIAKSVQDKLQFHFDKSVFSKAKNPQFWNPVLSWKNKYKNGDKKQGEKFLGSSTIFVSLTDGWHLFGLIRNLSIISIIPIATLNPWWLISYVTYFLIFHIFFTYVFQKNK